MEEEDAFLVDNVEGGLCMTTPMPKSLEDAKVEAIRIKAKWENDEYICRGHILDGMSDSLYVVYTNVESAKELWDLLESKYMADDSLSKKFLEKGLRTNPKTKVDAIACWIDSGATTHACKDRCWFMTYDPVEDGSVLYMGDDHFAHVHRKGSVVLKFSSGKSITLFNVLYVSKLPPYTPQQNGVAERKNRALKEMVNSMLSYSGLSRGAVVRLLDPKRKTLGEKGIDCICVGYAEHPRHIESRDAIFDENRFSSIPRPKDIIPNSVESQRDDHSNDVSRCKPLDCKCIFKRKMKVDGTIDKFKARLSIQGFRQKEGVDYFDTYAPVARITTIRLLALAVTHNIVIHQMDVKTAFLNGYLDEEVYMKQPEGFVMPGNEHKVCKLVKSLYGLKQAPKQWH
uniref:Zinc finger, CCHC-type n=1 Tax=Tanacetum cinerariifolium TaxID=118510 RepID=A0A699GNB0_TANCI|nr:zinc finger, CCHC-type [Tanacetum cinerariifolium]